MLDVAKVVALKKVAEAKLLLVLRNQSKTLPRLRNPGHNIFLNKHRYRN